MPSDGFIPQLTAHTTPFPGRVPFSNTLLPVEHANTSSSLCGAKIIHHTRSKSDAAEASSTPGSAGPAGVLAGH